MAEAELNEQYTVEDLAIKILKDKLSYNYVHGKELTPKEGERESYRHVILKPRFIGAIKRLNPWLTESQAEKVYQKVVDVSHREFSLGMKEFYDMLTIGVKLKVGRGKDERTRLVKLVDFENPDNNEFLVSNQFRVDFYRERGLYRVPDMVVFINGIPIAVFEFKGPNSPQTAKDAYEDHMTKKGDIPQLYKYAQILVVSDGIETKYGSPTSPWERFFVWEGIESDDDLRIISEEGRLYKYPGMEKPLTSLEVLLMGLFQRERLLEYLNDFIIHEGVERSFTKKIAMYHQFYAVRKAIERTVRAVKYGKRPEEKRIGTIWHTQGSGKSLTMLFYARRALKAKELENPMLLFITDRRELDDQLYDVFTGIMRNVNKAESVKELRELLSRKAGGVVFATIQKFGDFDRYIVTSSSEGDIENVKEGKIRRGFSIRTVSGNEEEPETGFIQVGELVVGEAIIKDVKEKKFDELSKEDIEGMGFRSLEELKDAIKREVNRKHPDKPISEKKLREKTVYIVSFKPIDWYKPHRRSGFYPILNDRHNLIVVADEAHRSQYKDLAKNLRKALPNASLLGFTATPIEYADKSTPLTFGDYISIYSMDTARRHGVVVPIYYESRLARLHLTNEFIDEEFEEISERAIKDPSIKEEAKEELKRKFARLERLMLSPDRLNKVAEDIVEHFSKRLGEFKGKAIVVTISRRVAVELYERLKEPMKKRFGPNSVAVVISGSKSRDPEKFHPHIRTKKELKALAKTFKDPDSELLMVIVVDMWLTGFDVPCLHTMYFDKPMKNHSLVQAIARVNRVFKDKPGGLIVDYIGIADDLKKSLSVYAPEEAKKVLTDINQILDLMKEKYDIVSSYFYGLDYKNWRKMNERDLAILTASAYARVSRDENTKKKFLKNVVALKKLYALASPHPETMKIKEDLVFFNMIKSMIIKYQSQKGKTLTKSIEEDMTELISKSIVAEKPIDVFELMKREKPDVSLLSDEFLQELTKVEYKNYVADVLTKILEDQIRVRMRKNPYRYKSLYQRLQEIIDKYNLRLIEVSEVIEELIQIAKETRKAIEEGKQLNLSEEELAFYDLLMSQEKIAQNYSQIEMIAKEIVKTLSGYVTVADWRRRKQVMAKIKNQVKRVLMKNFKGLSYNEIKALSEVIVNQAAVLFGEKGVGG
ncbi:HsdR family type I site-specific deoxyribonuclease [Thermococcus stetteri]|uniref:HsdR family type I site-specific deoxyribonuclease n=1 Tax=Thermococcus stetteri TaxID=49900 RepID=UPI001AE264CB|nr:HsdR family type I site-specific deoxyribonuclease [Thermococcus stetteri]MBP1912999.1 type I site-specific restriction-modification system R (restriction) subunit [Thermococcus stetteri]